MPPERATRRSALVALAATLVLAAALWLLAPVLTPFLLAAVAAYACAPLVGRMQRWGLPRSAGAVVVLVALAALAAAVVLLIVPLAVREMQTALARAPAAVTLFNERVAPWLRERLGAEIQLDSAGLTQAVAENWDSLRGLLPRVLDSLRIGGLAVVGFLVNALLTPVVMFYLLRDWDAMIGRLAALVPHDWRPQAARLAGEIDTVLGHFLRGQLLVMAALAAYYSAGLALAGVGSALSLGMLTGLLIFVPYLGFATGFLLALLVAALQLQGFAPVAGVLIVFGIGQAAESFVLTPVLVGSRVGLHPLAGIFALMAFGQVFGFLGVLLALPAAAAIAVGIREAHRRWLASPLYRNTR